MQVHDILLKGLRYTVTEMDAMRSSTLRDDAQQQKTLNVELKSFVNHKVSSFSRGRLVGLTN
jgi:hypothetical protein